MTGTKGTFVISWSQTEIDGLAGAPVGTIEVGASWRWTGPPVCVDGPNDRLVLTEQAGEAELRSRAARAVRRLVGPALGPSAPIALADSDEPVLDRYFVVSDGRRSFPVTLIDTGPADGAAAAAVRRRPAARGRRPVDRAAGRGTRPPAAPRGRRARRR
jgi:hypothetical protein